MNGVRCASVCFVVSIWTSASAHAALIGVDWDSGNLYNVSTANAALTLIGSTGVAQLSGLEFAPSGLLYGFSSGATPTLYTINPTTAAATPVGLLGMTVFEGGLVFSPAGVAYAVSGGNSQQPQLLQLNLTTGAATVVTNITGGPHDINGLAWRSDGQLVGLDRSSSGLILINPTTGATSLLATLPTDIGATGGMAVVGNTGYLSTSGPGDIIPGSNRLYSFDLSTGAATLIGSFTPAPTGTGLGGLAIPEPVTLIYALASGLCIVRRREKAAA